MWCDFLRVFLVSTSFTAERGMGFSEIEQKEWRIINIVLICWKGAIIRRAGIMVASRWTQYSSKCDDLVAASS